MKMTLIMKLVYGTRAEYPVDKETYEQVKFGDWAKVKYVASQFQDRLSIQPKEFALIVK